MGDCGYVIPELEREEDLIAAAKHISIIHENVNEVEGITEIEKQLNVVQEKIMSWETDQSMIWDSSLDEATQYLNAADEARKFVEKLEALSSNNKDCREKELLQRSHDILQIAMTRLEEEFKHILLRNRQPFEPERVSFRSSAEDTIDFSSVISLGDNSVEKSINRDSVSRNSEEFIIDLVHPEVISDLRCIANLMFISKYGHECSQAYISVRRDALDECLFILEMEKLSIEDVLKLEWRSLNSKIKRWVRAMKMFVRVYLASEKYLIEQIFGDLGTVNLVCFAEALKGSILQLLIFGDAISMGPHKPEKLFPIFDMYEVLADLFPDIDSLYSDDAGFCVRTDCREVLKRLGDSVKTAFRGGRRIKLRGGGKTLTIFLGWLDRASGDFDGGQNPSPISHAVGPPLTAFHEFEMSIATSVSLNPFPGGGIHHLTRYVMNYINTLADYRETLNFLLRDENGEDPVLLSPDMSPPTEEENRNDVSPIARHFRSVASILKCNLDDKAKLYKDPSLQSIFLMNNIHYMTQKIKNSVLRHIFGDDWIRKHNRKLQQHAMNYERATWSSVLAPLKVDGNHNSDSVWKSSLKKRFRNFNLDFEEVYRTQTAWIIPDQQLREELQILSVKVIQAYRAFVGRYNYFISEEHIKHSADDLEMFLDDLFQGCQKSLQNPHRR
ncbi:exocyst complex component EXO70E2-like [Euphorbia lathyris]|uniref:exocyst complex component EXO70E2-like n=1 Tax=Euphorbia lathyris TaxID=212925 RepID=UPI0033139942